MSHLPGEDEGPKRPQAAPVRTQDPKRAKTAAAGDDDEYPLPPEPDYVVDREIPRSVVSDLDMMYRLVARDGLYYEAREYHQVCVPDAVRRKAIETVVLGGGIGKSYLTPADLVRSTRARRLQVGNMGQAPARIEPLDDAAFDAGITELCIFRPADIGWRGTTRQLDALDVVDTERAGPLLANQTNLKSLRIGSAWLTMTACHGVFLDAGDAKRILDNTKLQHIWLPMDAATLSILEQFTRRFGRNVRSLGLDLYGQVSTETLRSIVTNCPRLHTLQLAGRVMGDPIDLASIEGDLHALVHLRDLRVDVRTERPLELVPAQLGRLTFTGRSVKEGGIHRAVHHLEFIHILDPDHDLGPVVSALSDHKGRPPSVQLEDFSRYSLQNIKNVQGLLVAVPGVRLVRPPGWVLRLQQKAAAHVSRISDAVNEQIELPQTVTDLIARFAFE